MKTLDNGKFLLALFIQHTDRLKQTLNRGLQQKRTQLQADYIYILITVNGNGSCVILEFVTLISIFICYVAYNRYLKHLSQS